MNSTTCKTCGGPIRWAQRANGSWYAAIPVPEGDGERPGRYWQKVARRPHQCATYVLSAQQQVAADHARNAAANEAREMIADLRARTDLEPSRKASLIATLESIAGMAR